MNYSRLALALLGLWTCPVRGDEFQDVSDSFSITHLLAGVHHGTTLDTNGISLNFWTSASEGAPAIATGLSNPHMAAADAAGNVYIADKASHAVLRIDTNGLIQTFAGTHVAGFNGDGPALATTLQIINPNGLFVFPNGTVYLLDPGNHRIRRVETNGMMSTIVNDPEPLWDPSGRALWVSPDEQLIYYTHEFLPLVVDGVTNLFKDGAAVKKWTATNGIETVCSKSVGFVNPANIDVNPVDGKLYVTDRAEEETNKVATGLFRIDGPDQRTRLTGNITQLRAADGQLAIDSFIDGPRGLAFRADGSYFLCGHRDGNVWFVDTGGVLHKYLRGKGSGDTYVLPDGRHPPLTSKDYFSQPRAVTLTPGGDLLVVCNDSGYVFQVDASPPVIRSGPDIPPAYFGSNVTVTVDAVSVRPLRYQWLKDGVPISGGTNATLTLTNLVSSDHGLYAVTVTNPKGSMTSGVAELQVMPVILQQPQPYTTLAGLTAEFSVRAIGADELTYQWYKEPRVALPGATNSSLLLTNVSAADRGNYLVEITSGLNGTVISLSAELIVHSPPQVIAAPTNQVASLGQLAAFQVVAAGDAALRYQWYHNDLLLPGQTNATLTFARTHASDAGDYSVFIATPFVATTSTVATLTVRLPANAPLPVVNITSPTAPFTRVPGSTLNVAGTAVAAAGLDQVRVYAGASTATILGASNRLNWQATVALAPGSNIIRVAADDLIGRSTTNARVVFSINPSPIRIAINPPGAGTVRGATNGQFLEQGRGYSLTAISGAGFVFSNWNGDAAASAPALTFIMQSNLMLTANFMTNPFIPWVGSYQGLYSDLAETRQERRGSFSALLRPNGGFSGKLQNGLKSFPFTGQFDLTGHSTNEVKRPGTNPLRLELALDLHGANQITGRVIDSEWSASLLADRAVFNRLNPAPFTNKYTLLIGGGTNEQVAPIGSGFGQCTIDASGHLKFSGVLADGTAVTQSASVSGRGVWPLYLPLYGGKGSLLGFVTFTNSVQPDLGGAVNWFKPPRAAGPFYTNGFSSDSTLTGSAYTPPGTNRLVDLDRAMVSFISDGLAAPLTNTILFGLSGRVTSADPSRLVFTPVPATGRWTATIKPSGSPTVLTGKGVFLQKHRYGGGFHVGLARPGKVVVQAEEQ